MIFTKGTKSVGINATFFLAILVIWQLVVELSLVSTLLVPSPLSILQSLPYLLFEVNIMGDVAHTLVRVLISIFLSVVIAIPLGLLIGYVPILRKFLSFYIDFFRSIPITALFPLFMLAFGIGDSSKIAAATFSASLIIVFSTIYGVKNANKTRIVMAKLMHVPIHKLFSLVIIYEAMPHIISGVRLGASMSLVIIVVTEILIGSEVGIGQKIYDYHFVYKIPEMYATIIMVGILGFMLNKIYLLIETRLIHWMKN